MDELAESGGVMPEGPEKDDRLFAPFPIEMDEHPKIIGLSDAAFRAIFEATFYSRRMLSDGFLDERVVMKRWGQKVADELSSNDPERPSWVRVDRGWRIHDFEKHHPLKAEIDAKRADLSAKRSQAGAKGAAKRWHPDSKRVANDSSETESESESKTETVKEPKARAVNGTRIPAGFPITDEMREWAKENVPLVKLDRELPAFIDYWAGVAGAKGVKRDWVATWRNSMRTKQRWAEVDSKPTPTAPRDLTPPKHTHRWLADNTCTLCEARRDREDTW